MRIGRPSTAKLSVARRVLFLKCGLAVPNYCTRTSSSPAPKLCELVSFAEKAEELGFDILWVIDHLLRPTPLYNVSWHDPTITLGLLAGVTKALKLWSAIFILPLRSPLIMAKEIASLDNLTEGRAILGVGNGWFDKEFEACGVSMKERRRKKRGVPGNHTTALDGGLTYLRRPILSL